MKCFHKTALKMLSELLAAVMLLGLLANLSFLPVFAEDEDADTPVSTEASAADAAEKADDGEAATADEADTAETEEDGTAAEGEEEEFDYLSMGYATAEEKLASMVKKLSVYGYSLFCDEYTGEIAFRNDTTGEILFSNPYDVGTATSSDNIKRELLSQILIRYYNVSENLDEEMNSFADAAEKSQINIKNLKNGVRVEYSLGDEETRYLVPMIIERSRYESLILPLIQGNPKIMSKFKAYYTLLDPYDTALSVRAVKEMQSTTPITEKMAVYVFDTEASARELKEIEGYIRQYCPEYTYAVLDEDHTITEYVSTQQVPALFKMALEYYIEEDGLQVRLPSNGIRYDEDEYRLNSVTVLPYFGAGSNEYTGYSFFPDGSGSIFRFEDMIDKKVSNITAKVYGRDYSKYEIGSERQETVTMPVFGVVTNFTGEKTVYADESDTVGTRITANEDRGFVAILESGESLATLTMECGTTQHKYDTVFSTFTPRSTDVVNLKEAISVSDDTEYPLVSNRKYTGSFQIKYVMLSDKGIANSVGLSDSEYYQASYVGMAKAYRTYLENEGILTKLTEENVKEDIPLYIESFGAVDEASSFLTFPITKKTALTTFENLKTISEELSDAGITNLNFRLTGFTNGGMESEYPYHLKFEKAVGGNSGYKDFIEYAGEKGIGLYPDFDFAYTRQDVSGDGISLGKIGAKSIDSRYMTKRVYQQAVQMFGSFNPMICISPASFSSLYSGFNEDYSELGSIGISVSTLGSDLNSDFDKKDPYTREDSKKSVTDVLSQMKEDYGSVMTDSGNAYTLQYIDHILNASLNSSNFNFASNTVPFTGLVLHGYVNFAGAPTNMSSDMDYEMLRIIENGASPYFTLSYQNTPLLKESWWLSQYYSVAYDIWVEDLIKYYDELNGILKDVQTSCIKEHQFLGGTRVPTEEENEEVAEAVAAARKAAEEAETARLRELDRIAKLNARKNGKPIPESTDITAAVQAASDAAAEATQKAAEANYVCNDGRIVKITYDNGTSYILNYNRFDVTTQGYTVEALGYVKVS